MTECIKHGPHAPGECPECDELAEARSIVATTYIPPAPLSEETDLFLKSLRGDSEIEFSIDPDGDLYIQIREKKGMPVSAYISGTNADKLKRWLNKVSR